MRLHAMLFAALIPLTVASIALGQPASTTGSEDLDFEYKDWQREGVRIMQNLKEGINVEQLEENLDRAMEEGIAAGETPGGVVLVQRNGQTVFAKAYGNRAVGETTEPATLDTIYDLASLTKPVATATSIMILVEQGKLRLSDRVSKYIPEWKNTPKEEEQKELLNKLRRAVSNGKLRRGAGMSVSQDEETRELLGAAYEAFPDLQSSVAVGDDFNLLPRDRESITIRHLLTHTSGLPSYERYYERYPEGGARKKIVSDIAKVDLRGPVGGQMIYSDLGFIVLGDLVERVSGMPLDKFATTEIFMPLGMGDTYFGAPIEEIDRTAPTEWRANGDGESTRTMIRGTVHDGNASVQDGIAGHAGLFSTAQDLAYFCDMMLNGLPRPNRVPVLSPLTVREMTKDHANLKSGEAQRGLGWDIVSSYNSQKGDLFESGYGHTGFTGTSIWIEPAEKIAVIVLSNRVHPDGKGNVVGLRARIANIVAGSIVQSYKDKSE